MARIAGVDLPREKRIEIGLTYIYGMFHFKIRTAQGPVLGEAPLQIFSHIAGEAVIALMV